MENATQNVIWIMESILDQIMEIVDLVQISIQFIPVQQNVTDVVVYEFMILKPKSVVVGHHKVFLDKLPFLWYNAAIP